MFYKSRQLGKSQHSLERLQYGSDNGNGEDGMDSEGI